MRPAVSILMPARNVERWIDDAIASVVDQRFADWKLYALDDASSDGTFGKLHHWAQSCPNIFVEWSSHHLGISTALNSLAALATGRLVMFMGADDYIGPKFLENAVECLELHPEATVACPPILEFERSIADDVSAWSPEFDLDRLHEANCIPGPSVFRRALFDAVPWPAGFEDTGCEDWARWVLVHRAGLLKPVRMWQPYHHRIREGGLSNNLAANLPSIRAKIRQLHETGALTVAPTEIGEHAA
jgi:glycosyltransferase involved in cell wall biosynthesis